MSKTGKFPVKSRTSGVVLVAGRWTGGGAAANCTKAAGRGIASVNYNSATGKYLVTFEDTFGQLVAFTATCGNASGTTTHNTASYDIANWSASAGTMPICISDVASPTLQDLATTEEISIIAVFAEGNFTQ
jgi:hypothetical protein